MRTGPPAGDLSCNTARAAQQGFYGQFVDIHQWWDTLEDDVRRVLLADRNRVLLPARTVAVYTATAGPALVEIDGRPGRWRWPSELRAFLLNQWSHDPDCE